MLTYLGAFISALIVAALLTPIVARLAYRVHAVDAPGEARKIHTRPIPRIGGLAVVAAYFTPILSLAVYTNVISALIYQDLRLVTALVLGSLAIVLLGVYDDIRGADAKLKFAVQTSVAVFMWLSGFRIELVGMPFGGALDLGLWSLPLTVLWIVGIVNAMNLIDGLDGLASGVALIAVLVLFGVAFIDHSVLLCVLTVSLAGALFGFLFFNFNPAKIFLGDSGSMFLGFILASVSVWTQRKGATAAALLVPVIALGLPILDTTLSVVRRVSAGRNPFSADREHVHHRLMALGLTHRGAVFTMYTISALFALGALAMLDVDATRRAIALATIAMAVIILVRRIGIFSRPIQGRPIEVGFGRARDQIRAITRRMRSASNLEDAWAQVCAVAETLEFRELRLNCLMPEAGEHEGREQVYRWRNPDEASGQSVWLLDEPLSPYDTGKLFVLAEGPEAFGTLAVLLGRRGVEPEHIVQRDLALELVREALIDFFVANVNAPNRELPAEVVRLSDSKPNLQRLPRSR